MITPNRLIWVLLISFLLLACGEEYRIKNTYVFEQEAACSIVPNDDPNCIDYLASITVVIVDQDKFSTMCNNQTAFGCARFANNTIYILEGFEAALCQVITHEFMHFLGRYYYGNSDINHNDFNFNESITQCSQTY